MSSSKDTSDLIVGHFRLITEVRDRTVEEKVLIDGVGDDDEDKLPTMTTAGASRADRLWCQGLYPVASGDNQTLIECFVSRHDRNQGCSTCSRGAPASLSS
ncbi:MAG TPA: hypothetical protein VLC46_06885 [Thermoanaerobaculia bacterium]|nr:hypothetical protein [Thermoanaerobaculia bacterium]